MPTVSILMPTYNHAKYLTISIDSVLGQTFKDFEFIIINDCSTDMTSVILEKYANLDHRIKVLSNRTKFGIANSLNLGLSIASGNYIARMDSDDICSPNRFEDQVNYLNMHPECGVLGSETCFINSDGSISDQPAWIKPTEHNSIAWSLIFSTPFCHPTIMMRHNILKIVGGYTNNYPNEDMDLWTRLAFQTRFANLENILLYYRMPYDMHLQKLQVWIPQIQNVSQVYIERILGRCINPKLVKLLITSNFNITFREDYETCELFQASYLLEEILEKMKFIGLLDTRDLSRVERTLYKQTQSIISLL